MKRIDALRAIMEERPHALLVCNLGFPSRELFHLNDKSSNFYMLGSMGMASSIGLGLAMAVKEREVISLDGDGSILMNLGSLATVASQKRDNFLLVIVDNGVYGSTGCQASPTSSTTRLTAMASAAGIQNVKETGNEEDLRILIREMRNGVLVVKTDPTNANVPNVSLNPREIIDRFMNAATRPPE